MVRDLARLANEAFDVLVIGGGIYGLTTLRELTARGLRAALVDRGDFGAATSFNSLKTVHGGIRALQHGALPTMREFVRARRDLASIAPHLVRPLPFVVPTYRHPVRNRPMMAAFLAIYDLLALDRNDGIDARLALPSQPHCFARTNACASIRSSIHPASPEAPSGTTTSFTTRSASRSGCCPTRSARARWPLTIPKLDNSCRATAKSAQYGCATSSQAPNSTPAAAWWSMPRDPGPGRSSSNLALAPALDRPPGDVDRDEPRGEPPSAIARDRRRGGRQVPLPRPVARPIDRRHQPWASSTVHPSRSP